MGNGLKKLALAAALATTLMTPKAKAQTAPTIDIMTPVAAAIPGAAGSNWRTDVWITNHDSADAKLDLYFAENGLPATPNATITVPAGQGVTLADIVTNTFHKEKTAGVLAVDVQNAAQAGKIELRSSVYNLQTDGGTAGSTFNGIFTKDLLPLGSNSYATTTANVVNFRDNVGAAAGQNGATITFTLFNKFGEAKYTRDVTLGAFQRVQQSITSLFGVDASQAPSQAGIEGGTIRAEMKSGSATWYNSENDNKSNAPIAHIGTSKVGLDFFVQGAGRTQGANNTFWQTDLKLHNTSDAATSVKIDYLEAGKDNSAPKSISYSIPPRQTLGIEDLMKNGFGLDKGNGALHITSTQAIIADSRTYNATANGSYGVQFSGQYADEAATSEESTYINSINNNGSTHTNVGFLNASSIPANVEFVTYGPDGQVLGSDPMQLPPMSTVQLNNINGQNSVDNAYGIVRVNTPNAKVLANGYAINNRTGQNTNNPAFRIQKLSVVPKIVGIDYDGNGTVDNPDADGNGTIDRVEGVDCKAPFPWTGTLVVEPKGNYNFTGRLLPQGMTYTQDTGKITYTPPCTGVGSTFRPNFSVSGNENSPVEIQFIVK